MPYFFVKPLKLKLNVYTLIILYHVYHDKKNNKKLNQIFLIIYALHICVS